MKLASTIVVLTTVLYLLSIVRAEDRQNSDITELIIETTHKPDDCSVTAAKGDGMKVHYHGALYTTGAKFDSSYDRGSPLPVRNLGGGGLIKGWEIGLEGTCVGEKRTLTIPAHLAYGDRGFPGLIPAGSALKFDVEIMEITKA